MRILFLNWRDSANSAAGGAETFTDEIGKRLVSLGNEVTVFASSFDQCERETYRFGMRVIRDGGKYSVYSKARGFAKDHLNDFDIVIDEINTIPFRVYKISRDKPIVAVIHQLAREVWFYETRFPINLLGYFALEPLWLRGYKGIPTITVSDSTKKDLLQLGFKKVHVIHNGSGVTPLKKVPEKDQKPVLVYLGRLVKCKRPDHAVTAFKLVKASIPGSELWVLGDGYLRTRLEASAPDGVKFFGRVGNEEKFKLLERAHLLLAPSVREGWGISVVEANAMGTPAIGYNVPGLRDSIVDGVTGLLVEPLNPQLLAEAAVSLLSSSATRERFSIRALEWSRNFSWDKSAEDFDSFLHNVIDNS